MRDVDTYTMSKGLGPLQIMIMDVIMDDELTDFYNAENGWDYHDLARCVYYFYYYNWDEYYKDCDKVTKNQKRSFRRALQSLDYRGNIHIESKKDYKKIHLVKRVELPPEPEPKPIPEPDFFCAWCKSEIFSETFDKHLREKHGSNLAKYRKLFGEAKKLDE